MRKRILVVERSRTIQTLLSISFSNADHQVLVCATPQEALRILADLQDAPDSIFLAVHAQEHDDSRLIQNLKVRAVYAHTRFVALVLQEDMAQVQRTLRNIPVSYLVKPFRIQDALALVSWPAPGDAAASEAGRERREIL